MHEKHRERLRKKLLTNSEILEEHELLELLLFYALPRKNTNDIAHNLISTFGSVREVLTADAKLLMHIEGVGEHTAVYLSTMGTVLEKCIKKNDFPEIFSFEQIRQPLINMFLGLKDEVFVAFFLDSRQRIIGKHIICDHSPYKVEIDLSAFSKQLLAHKTTFVVIAHNHLSNVCTPTENDDVATEKLCMICKLYGVNLVDHLIATDDDVYSYYYENRIDDIKKRVNSTI